MTDPLIATLSQVTSPDIVKGELADRLQWAGDASIYHLIPRVVVLARDGLDVQIILRIAQQFKVKVCFRAGGTSLSGQAVTDGILIVVSRYMRNITVSDDASMVTCEPGAVGSWVNAALAPHHKRIGPDPASIQAAEIGGIIANNASGMCCGVHENSYQTVTSMDVTLANGFRFDTGADDANDLLQEHEADLYEGLLALRDQIRKDETLAEQITTAFKTKNTVGYSLNAFIDEDEPAQILQKLIVGSEGTLAFINKATFRCIDLPSHKATALLLFSSVEAAGAAVDLLAQSGAAAIELLDAISLKRVHDKLPGDAVEGDETAALLVEYQERQIEHLDARVEQAVLACKNFDLVRDVAFTRDPAVQAQLWSVRKGLFPSVGAVRKAKTAVVIEDVTFPVARLAEGVRALRVLFSKYQYDDAVIFGHAKDGNLHFTLTPNFSEEEEVERYRLFMDELVKCVVGMDGHLKAEHGTGRNMAPFVEAQWGPRAVDFMYEVKNLFDPQQLINPGVLLTEDPDAHIKHLKLMPQVNDIVDRCIECGFCEPVCPSRDATLSPRQRISLLRHAAQGPEQANAVKGMWQHSGLNTCAADGMCATACPVDINTGDLVKAERTMGRGMFARFMARRMAKNLRFVSWSSRVGLRMLRGIGIKRLPGRKVSLPRAAKGAQKFKDLDQVRQRVVYFPSCLSRSFAGAGTGAPEALGQIAESAGVQIILPPKVKSLCCGQPFASKGFPDLAQGMQDKIVEQIKAITDTHDKVLIIDTSTCAAQLEALGKALPDWRILHPAAAMTEIFIPLLKESGKLNPSELEVVLHPTCSERKHNWMGDLERSIGSVAQSHIPRDGGCCGMAGDRGWLEPTLTEAATARESANVNETHATRAASTNLACGLAMQASTGIDYEHLWSIIAEHLKEDA